MLLWSCGDKKNGKESIDADYQTVAETVPSVVSIPLQIEIAQLEALIEQQADQLQFSGDKEDNRLEVKVSKASEPIKIEVFNESIRYQVPLQLDIAYDLGITRPKAKGVLALDLRSDFNIDSSWTLSTNTTLISHKWLDEPNINVGGFSLPITSVANYAIRQAEGSLERAIDMAVNEQIRLERYVTDAWNQMQRPILVAEEEQAWLSIHPTNLQMTPLQSDEKSISATVRLEALPRLTFGEEPSPTLVPFPAFEYAANEPVVDNFNLYLGSNISYAEAERLASNSVVGETFSSGNKSISVDDLKLFGQSGKLIIELATSGTYNGAIYLSGVPEYNLNQGRLKIRNLDFTLKTKSFLTKTAAWLLKGRLKKQLQDNMNEILQDNLAGIHKELSSQLEQQQLANGINLNGQLNELQLANTYLTEDGLEVVIHLKGQLDLNIDGLTQMLVDEE